MTNITQQYKDIIKDLEAKRAALDKQIGAVRDAMRANESIEGESKPKRKQRERTPETKALEGYIQDVFRQNNTPSSMKLIEVIRAVMAKQPDVAQTEDEMRGKFHNLKKSNFLTSDGVPYGHVKLTKSVRVRKPDIEGEEPKSI